MMLRALRRYVRALRHYLMPVTDVQVNGTRNRYEKNGASFLVPVSLLVAKLPLPAISMAIVQTYITTICTDRQLLLSDS